MLQMDIVRYCFNIACFAAAFGMTLLWICRYVQDRDSVEVDLKPFDFPIGQYPTLSFCFMNPFIASKLEKYNDNITVDEYKDVLTGKRSYVGNKDIDFNSVTLNLADFYLGENINFTNGSSITHFQQEFPQVTYSGSFDFFYKCFGLSSKFKEVDAISFEFNSSAYENGIRPLGEKSIFVIFHLPKQFVLGGHFYKHRWPTRKERKEHIMSFSLLQVEILKRRNKEKDPCISDDLNFDQIILDDHLNNIGCKGPHQKTSQRLNICSSTEKMNEANFDLVVKKKMKKACTSASTLGFNYHEVDVSLKGSDRFYVKIHYPYQYKEIVMIQAVDIETVIANAGGYIGLFLGKVMVTLTKKIENHKFLINSKFQIQITTF